MISVDLTELFADFTDGEIQHAVSQMTTDEAEAFLKEFGVDKPQSPLEQALVLDEMYRPRDHLQYLSERLAKAMQDVEAGESRYMVVSMPPRMGKSQLSSVYLPTWILSRHPDWPIGLISHDPSLAVNWGRDIRNLVDRKGDELGVTIAPDAGAAAEWKTTDEGGLLSRSVGQSITGRGFKCLLIDDPTKDYAAAHSAADREKLWNWWRVNAMTRQNGPWLVVFIGTRWHEDDILGRLTSSEYDGDPDEWEIIKFPAIAEEHDILGRAPGDPLLSPLWDETRDEALLRWKKLKKSVGTYAWSALYQQSPSPAEGAVFSMEWPKFWTPNPANVSRAHDEACHGYPCSCPPDGKVVLIDPYHDLATAQWTDSWDCAFKATTGSDYVVGQRWAALGANRYLVHQFRGRRTFTQTKQIMINWADQTSEEAPYSDWVSQRLIEDKANGTAIIDDLKEAISSLIPINPTESKEARARAVTPQMEGGNVFFPYPGDPGNEWVQDLLSELREFPSGAHDDQVDALSQYLNRSRSVGNVTPLIPRATINRGYTTTGSRFSRGFGR